MANSVRSRLAEAVLRTSLNFKESRAPKIANSLGNFGIASSCACLIGWPLPSRKQRFSWSVPTRRVTRSKPRSLSAIHCCDRTNHSLCSPCAGLRAVTAGESGLGRFTFQPGRVRAPTPSKSYVKREYLNYIHATGTKLLTSEDEAKHPLSGVKALSTTDCDQWHLAITICGLF